MTSLGDLKADDKDAIRRIVTECLKRLTDHLIQNHC